MAEKSVTEKGTSSTETKRLAHKHDWSIFFASVFFVLGFSSVFSLLGVLLQGVLASASVTIQTWLSRIGGVIIILFALYLLKLFKPKFLEQEHKLHITKRFKSRYVTSFVFGAAFAVGWTPCVGAVLGAILTLAATEPSQGFALLFSYSLGLGIPFLIVGLFTNEARKWISHSAKWITYVQYIFGALLLAIGVLVFTNQLSRVSNLQFAASFLAGIGAETISFGSSLHIGIAFLAGVVSFLSPCVLPLIPAYLTYLASEAVRK